MSAHAQDGIVCKIESGAARRAWPERALCGVCGLLLYTALWGALCSMAALSTLGVLPLLPGGLLVLVFPILPLKKRASQAAVLAVGAAALVLLLLRWDTAADGVKLLLNRLFAASEAQQAYTYDKFVLSSAEGAWQGCIRYALVLLGVSSGALCAAASRRRWRLLPAAAFVLYAAAAAYLGVSPEPGWNILLAAALILSFLEVPKQGGAASGVLCRAAGLILLALVCGAVWLAAPGEDPRLSAWEEQARDVLALQTVAYTEAWRKEPEPEPEEARASERFYQEEETPGSLDGEARGWTKPVCAALAILLFGLLLFLPAVLSDLQKKRRAKNRLGLEDPDHGGAIRAMFLYTLRWLRLGGLTPVNAPFSDYAGPIAAAFSPELRAKFEEVLPLWQEAAYSAHTMTGEQRARMRRFMEEAVRCVWAGLGRKDRMLANYVYAL